MTRVGNDGSYTYSANQNPIFSDGIDGNASSQICGQGLVTKLLRNKKPMSTPLALADDIELDISEYVNPTLCLVNNGLGKKVNNFKLRSTNNSHNMIYQTMKDQSVSGTDDSCTSDDLFSQCTNSSSVSASTDDIQKTHTIPPAFVAQFDPSKLSTAPGSSSNNNKKKAKGGPLWSASLPAVVEEDGLSISVSTSATSDKSVGNATPQSKSRLRSLLGLSASGSRDSSEDDDDDEDVSKSSNKEETILSIVETKAPDELSLMEHESESMSNQPEQLVGRASDEEIADYTLPKDEQRDLSATSEATESKLQQESNVEEKPQQQQPFVKLTKEQREKQIKEAMGKRIQMVMEQTDHQDVGDLFAIGVSNSKSYTGIQEQRLTQQSVAATTGNALPPPELSRTMQDLLLQQQKSLKEMSLQNYHYRRELSECHDTFVKWRAERLEHQHEMEKVVRQRDAYEAEALFLREELVSIRNELEALKKTETARHHKLVTEHVDRSMSTAPSTRSRTPIRAARGESTSNSSQGRYNRERQRSVRWVDEPPPNNQRQWAAREADSIDSVDLAFQDTVSHDSEEGLAQIMPEAVDRAIGSRKEKQQIETTEESRDEVANYKHRLITLQKNRRDRVMRVKAAGGKGELAIGYSKSGMSF